MNATYTLRFTLSKTESFEGSDRVRDEDGMSELDDFEVRESERVHEALPDYDLSVTVENWHTQEHWRDVSLPLPPGQFAPPFRHDGKGGVYDAANRLVCAVCAAERIVTRTSDTPAGAVVVRALNEYYTRHFKMPATNENGERE